MSQITDSDLITDDKVDFLLAEAKEQLTATVADAEALTKSGVYLLGWTFDCDYRFGWLDRSTVQWREILVAAEMGNHCAAVVNHALRGSGCRDDHVDGAFLKRT